MDEASKRRSRPIPDADNLKNIVFKLEEALQAEYKYLSNFLLIQDYQRSPWEVKMSSRDGAVHILRFLRIWFEFPHSVYFSAVSYLDQFIGKMKVQEKHLNCLAISCFYVAASVEGYEIDKPQLVTVSQSKCSVKDMLRMSDIVKQKLNTTERAITCADFLTIYLELLGQLAIQWDAEKLFMKILQKEQLLTRLEVLVADNSCIFSKPSVLSLVLLHIEIQKFMLESVSEKTVFYPEELLRFAEVIGQLHVTCQIAVPELINSFSCIAKVLQHYDSQDKMKHCQNLLWRFSTSTIAMSNRIRSFHMMLGTIDEVNQNV